MRQIISRPFGRFILRRAAQSLLVVLALIAVNFFLIHLAPGDPVHALAGQSGDEEYYEFVRAKFGLDQPLGTQLWIYLSRVLRGDLGYSLSHQQPVAGVIFGRLPATLLLMLSAITLSAVAGVALGVEAARREGGLLDRAINTGALLGYSVPSFSIGHLLLIVFALHLGLFPAQNMASSGLDLSGPAYRLDVLAHLALPAATLTIVYLAPVMRLTRTEMLGALGEGYVTTARAKGVAEGRVLYGHALRNALLPVVTIIGSDFGMLLSGASLVETVFAWPGLGRLIIEAMAARDYPVLLGVLLLSSVCVAAVNLIVDVVYSLLDPRISYGLQKR